MSRQRQIEGFDGNLAGFKPITRNIIVELINKNWTGRLSSKGHAIMRSPNGVSTIAVSRSIRSSKTIDQIYAEIKRIETQELTGEVWSPIGDLGKILTDGEIYKCASCNFSAEKVSIVTGHIAGNHTENLSPFLPGENKVNRKRRKEEMQLTEQQQDLTQPQASILDWLAAMPTEAIKQLLELQSNLQALQAENKRLREGLKTLSDLAKEI